MVLPPGTQEFLWMLRHGVWGVGTLSWVFGISDRTLAAFMDGYLSAIDITQLLTAVFFFASWLILKPSRTEAMRSDTASETAVAESSSAEPST